MTRKRTPLSNRADQSEAQTPQSTGDFELTPAELVAALKRAVTVATRRNHRSQRRRSATSPLAVWRSTDPRLSTTNSPNEGPQLGRGRTTLAQPAHTVRFAARTPSQPRRHRASMTKTNHRPEGTR